MNVLRNYFAGIVLFTVLVVLVINAYSGMQEGYDFNQTNNMTTNVTTGNLSIMHHINQVPLVEGINNITDNMRELSAGGTLFDVVGSLAGVAVGTIKTMFGLIVAPYSIGTIITTFYGGSQLAQVLVGLSLMLVVYASFIFVSAKLGKNI